MKKTMLWTIAGMFVIAGLSAVYFIYITNPNVVAELRAEPDSALAEKVMLLTFASGKTLPVNYLRKGGTVYAGADFGWWKDFVAPGAPVTLLIKGESFGALAQAIVDDPARTAEVFARLRPTVPGWLPSWLNGTLVVFRLNASS